MAQQGLEPRVFRWPCKHSTTELPSHPVISPTTFRLNPTRLHMVNCWTRYDSYKCTWIVVCSKLHLYILVGSEYTESFKMLRQNVEYLYQYVFHSTLALTKCPYCRRRCYVTLGMFQFVFLKQKNSFGLTHYSQGTLVSLSGQSVILIFSLYIQRQACKLDPRFG